MRLRTIFGLVSVAVLGVTLAHIEPAAAGGFRAGHVTKAQIRYFTMKEIYNTTFGLTSTTTTAGTFVPPSGATDQGVSACTGISGTRYTSGGKVYTSRYESGCGPLIFSFNPATWTATAKGTISSSWYAYVERKTKSGRWVFTSSRRGHSRIAVSLTWKNPGAPVYGVSPYPAVASVDSYGYVERPVQVVGTLGFRGLGLRASLGSQPGSLRVEDRLGAWPM